MENVCLPRVGLSQMNVTNDAAPEERSILPTPPDVNATLPTSWTPPTKTFFAKGGPTTQVSFASGTLSVNWGGTMPLFSTFASSFTVSRSTFSSRFEYCTSYVVSRIDTFIVLPSEMTRRLYPATENSYSPGSSGGVISTPSPLSLMAL